MQYKELYKVLMRHGLSCDDRSGWYKSRPDYIDAIRPLWIVVEDRPNRHRIWITQSGSEMRVAVSRMDDKGGNIRNIARFYCKHKKRLAEIVRTVLEEPESSWAQDEEAV